MKELNIDTWDGEPVAILSRDALSELYSRLLDDTDLSALCFDIDKMIARMEAYEGSELV